MFVTPAITTFCTVALCDSTLRAVNTLQCSFVADRPVSAIVQFRMTEEPARPISTTGTACGLSTKRQFSARAFPFM